MGCDIHPYVEVRQPDGTWSRVDVTVFNYRIYAIYGFLANVRNYSASPTIALPRGLPSDVSREVAAEYDVDYHSASWLTLRELQSYDYEQQFENRRHRPQVQHHSADFIGVRYFGRPSYVVLKDFLSDIFFRDVARLAELGNADDVRVVFWFDS